MLSKKRKKVILLVNPPYYRLFKKTYTYNKYPLPLGYLATAIKSSTDWTPKVYNADFALLTEPRQLSYLKNQGFVDYRRNLENKNYPVWNEVRKIIQNFQPEIIGITCCSSTSKSAQAVANIAKSLNKDCTVIIGGPHPSLIRKEALADTNIDIVIKGEGEDTIVDLLNKIGNNETIENVKGIIYRANNEIKENPDREPIQNLDKLAFPAKWAEEILIDYEKYPASVCNAILTSRGCIGNCLFCGSHAVFSRKTRFRSPEDIVEEIQFLQKKGVTIFEILDDTFGINGDILRKLCRLLTEKCQGIKWKCETRVDLITEENLALMKKAGCTEIEIGIESGNNEVLKQIRKNITIEQAMATAKIIKKKGIVVCANFLIGLPMDTIQTINDTYKAMQKIDGKINFSIFTPYPGSEGFEYCKKANIMDCEGDPSLYNHQSPENCFTMNINKATFKAISEEMERYVEVRNSREELKQLISTASIYKLINFGTFRSLKSLKTFTVNAATEIRLMLKR
jgi:radical SAM superfamily enzyme YgiQ (UPF0313 family)